jgi:hypothetical protein
VISRCRAAPTLGHTQTQPINGEAAHVGGVEMSWQQHLAFLPGALSGPRRPRQLQLHDVDGHGARPGRRSRVAASGAEQRNVDATYDRRRVRTHRRHAQRRQHLCLQLRNRRGRRISGPTAISISPGHTINGRERRRVDGSGVNLEPADASMRRRSARERPFLPLAVDDVRLKR